MVRWYAFEGEKRNLERSYRLKQGWRFYVLFYSEWRRGMRASGEFCPRRMSVLFSGVAILYRLPCYGFSILPFLIRKGLDTMSRSCPVSAEQ